MSLRGQGQASEYTRFQPWDEEEDPLLGEDGAAGSSGIPRVTANWRRAWRSVFRRGESAKVNHQFTAQERARLANVESIDYLAPNSAMYRKWLARQPHRRHWDRWLLMGIVGVTTGLVAHLLYAFISLLADVKFGVTRWLIQHANMGVAWLFNASLTTALVAASSALVVGWAPEAIGSGIPEVMAYLNGCMMPRVFNIFTLAAKFASCALAVGAGLPVGPEGPLVHIGAALGSAISQGHSTTMGFSTGLFKRFRNPKDKRDFVTAGVSVGVATAFNAPIGGLLFAFEEVASFWQHSLGWQVFFACTCATLALNLSKSLGAAITGRGHFGWFDKEVAFEAGLSFSSHVLAVVPAFIIGITAGLFAAAFTVANLQIARLRDALMGHLKWKRMIEPVALALIYTTGAMVLPLFFPCTPTECVVTTAGTMQCETGLSGGEGAYGVGVLSEAPPLPLYTCRVDEHPGLWPNGTSHWIPNPGSLNPDDLVAVNGTKTVYYNQLATLLLNTGEEGIKHLFTRGTHRRFGYGALAVLGGFYFIGAALFAGSAISSGLFVPMLMLGAVIGRFMGLATVDIAQAAGTRWSPEVVGEWSWIDPGAFALVGAGAFMGGVTRLTIALAVIMIEVSSDVHMLLPVLVAIMTAKWVADAACHSLYHGLLAVKCVPFLPPEPISRYSLDLIPVSYVMRSPVVTLRQRMKVREITEALRGVSHSGFPVVRDTAVGQVAIGLVTRSHLMALLQRIVVEGRVEGLEVGWSELNHRMMDPVMAQRSVQEQQMVALQREMANSMSMAGVRLVPSPIPSGTGSFRSPGGLHSSSSAGGGLGHSSSFRYGSSAAAAGVGADGGLGSTLTPRGKGLGSQPGLSPGRGRVGSDGGPLWGPPGGGSSGTGLQAEGDSTTAAAAGGVGLNGHQGPLGTHTSSTNSLSGPAADGPGGQAGQGARGFQPHGQASGNQGWGSTWQGQGQAGGAGGGHGTSSSEDIDEMVVDLMPYVNTSSFVVPDSFSVERTYILFRTMGLRHLMVIDDHNRVRGIVTRKDLMGYRLDEALQKAMSGVSSSGNGPSGTGSSGGGAPGGTSSTGLPPRGPQPSPSPASNSLGNNSNNAGGAQLLGLGGASSRSRGGAGVGGGGSLVGGSPGLAHVALAPARLRQTLS